MSEITEDHLEWAVVRRLAIMLETPDPQFNVTHAYGMLAPIVCWVMQRTRAKDGPAATLRNTLIIDSPWNLSHFHIRRFKPGLITSERSLAAYDFFIGLRNAIAHGDARKVKPINSPPDSKDRCTLEGFSFECEAYTSRPPRPPTMLWSGTIHLLEADIRRLGLELADQFCINLGVKKPNFSIIASERIREPAT
ncbi:MAG: hypothetical protein AB7H71_07315 [Alphaproteobacteria bacterium]